MTFGEGLHCTWYFASEVEASQTLKLGSQQGEEFRRRSIVIPSRSLLMITTAFSASMSASLMLPTSPRSQDSLIRRPQSPRKHILSLDYHGSHSTMRKFLWQTIRVHLRPLLTYSLSRKSTLPVHRQTEAVVKQNVGVVHMRWQPSPWYPADMNSVTLVRLQPPARNAVGG